MGLTRRQKTTTISLLLYWCGIFILTHISAVNVSHMVLPKYLSDKTLHYLAYLLLVFLLWFAINPQKKVKWHQATVWWIIFIVVWYGVADEWLQGYVGRDPDVKDFYADMAGAFSSLVLLTIFSFGSAVLVVTGIFIFILTNLTEISIAQDLPTINALMIFFSYGFFAILWQRYMHHYIRPKSPQIKWLLIALATPLGLLITMQLFGLVFRGGFRYSDITIAATAIVGVVGTFYLTALFRKRISKKLLQKANGIS